jgi:hypothetical protein
MLHLTHGVLKKIRLIYVSNKFEIQLTNHLGRNNFVNFLVNATDQTVKETSKGVIRYLIKTNLAVRGIDLLDSVGPQWQLIYGNSKTSTGRPLGTV